MFGTFNANSAGWLAFELNILRRLKFDSAILPFTRQPHLGAYLKRWNARVLANDPTLTGWTKAVANIQNNSEMLSEEAVNLILEDAYVPRFRLKNSALRRCFSEIDAWWFDNVRQNIERLNSPVARAIASHIAISVGDYAQSFSAETLELRQPLSNVYRRFWNLMPAPINNRQNNVCQNKSASEFIAENQSDLMFLRLPEARNQTPDANFGAMNWSEEWLRGDDSFRQSFEEAQTGRLGARIETKSQYLHLVEEFLRIAAHIPVWAIAHVEDGFISTQEIVEIVSRVRRVNTIFTKDFSEFTGTKAIIITA